MRDKWRRVAELMHDEPDDDGPLAPACCHFCGGVTRDGLLLFPSSGDGMWPVCRPCMGAAMRRGRRTNQRAEFRFERSPN